jgi:hypothetical protein
MRISRSACGYGSFFSSTPSITLKIALLAPMLNASVRIMTSANVGFINNCRNAYRVSSSVNSINPVPLASRQSSFTCSCPPKASRACRFASSSVMPRFMSFSTSR